VISTYRCWHLSSHIGMYYGLTWYSIGFVIALIKLCRISPIYTNQCYWHHHMLLSSISVYKPKPSTVAIDIATVAIDITTVVIEQHLLPPIGLLAGRYRTTVYAPKYSPLLVLIMCKYTPLRLVFKTTNYAT
jgi:hypothetical protein